MSNFRDDLDRLADELFRCDCATCIADRQARLIRNMEIKYGCATEAAAMQAKTGRVN